MLGTLVEIDNWPNEEFPQLTTSYPDWRFDPTLLNGEPVEGRMTVSAVFRLSQQQAGRLPGTS